MNNVIKFPVKKKKNAQVDAEAAKAFQVECAETVISNLFEYVIYFLGKEGYDITPDKLAPDSTLLFNAIRSATYRTMGVEHPLHEIADDLFHDLWLEDPQIDFETVSINFIPESQKETFLKTLGISLVKVEELKKDE